MTPRTLADVLLKVWGFTLVVGALLSVSSVVSQLSMGTSDAGSWRIAAGWNLVHVLLTLIAGITVIKVSPTIAERLAPGEAPETPVVFPSLDVVAFGVLGAFLLVEGLRDLASLIFQILTKPVYENETLSYMWRQAPEALIGAGVQTIAGLALFMGRVHVSELLRGIRRTPQPRYDGDDDGGSPTPRSN